VLPEHEATIKELFQKDSFMTLKQAAERLEIEYGLNVSTTTISRLIHSFGFTLKKPSIIPIRRNWEETIKARYE